MMSGILDPEVPALKVFFFRNSSESISEFEPDTPVRYRALFVNV